MRMLRNLRITAIISVALMACIILAVSLLSNLEARPSFGFPTEDVLPEPTFTAGEPFACWTAPSPGIRSEEKAGSGQLLVVYHRLGIVVSLYRYDFATAEYSLLASNVVDPLRTTGLSISLNGRYLWYSVYLDRSSEVIFVYDLLDDTARQVAFPDPVDISADVIRFSADSQCLIRWRGDAATALRLSDGAVQQKVFPGVDFTRERVFRPSPDGRWWAWRCAESVCAMSAEGQLILDEAQGLRIVNRNKDNEIYLGRIRWSPNGDILAFDYTIKPRAQLTPGPHAVRLTYIEQDRTVSYHTIHLLDVSPIANLDWSPDSRQLLISTQGAVRIYDTVTEELTELPDLPGSASFDSPIWSPDGKRLAFISEDGRGLYITNTDGTGLLEITPPPYDANDAPIPTISMILWIP